MYVFITLPASITLYYQLYSVYGTLLAYCLYQPGWKHRAQPKRICTDPSFRGAVGILEGRTTIQRNRNNLEGWANRNLIKFSHNKCKALHLAWSSPLHQCRLGSSCVEKDWWSEGAAAHETAWPGQWPSTSAQHVLHQIKNIASNFQTPN